MSWALVGLCVTLLGVIVYLLQWNRSQANALLKKTEEKAAIEVADAKKDETIARLEGELTVSVRDGEEAWRQAEQLAEGLQHALKQSPSVATGLAADDVGGRLSGFRRLAEARAASDRAVPGEDAALSERDRELASRGPAAASSDP